MFWFLLLVFLQKKSAAIFAAPKGETIWLEKDSFS